MPLETSSGRINRKGNGRPPMPFGTMLRIYISYFMWQWHCFRLKGCLHREVKIVSADRVCHQEPKCCGLVQLTSE